MFGLIIISRVCFPHRLGFRILASKDYEDARILAHYWTVDHSTNPGIFLLTLPSGLTTFSGRKGHHLPSTTFHSPKIYCINASGTTMSNFTLVGWHRDGLTLYTEDQEQPLRAPDADVLDAVGITRLIEQVKRARMYVRIEWDDTKADLEADVHHVISSWRDNYSRLSNVQTSDAIVPYNSMHRLKVKHTLT